MKKSFATIICLAVVMVFGVMFMAANAADDYKVIKNAVNPGKTGAAQYLKISVTDKKTNKVDVNLKFPLILIDSLAENLGDIMDNDEADKEEKEDMKKCIKGVEFKKILQVLKENGPMTLVEVDTEDELVKIWSE